MSAPDNPPPGAVVIDANIVIALCAKEAGREPIVVTELSHYSSLGYEFYAPGVLISEALYILCGKEQNGTLSAAGYKQAIIELENIAAGFLPTPDGEAALIARSAEIRKEYGCSRSADSIYIALAELLALTRPTVLLTFDQGVRNHVAANAPTVTVQIIEI